LARIKANVDSAGNVKTIKVWMCGGRVVTSPCSRVGHMFRPVHAYNYGDESPADSLLKNTKRALLVWTDGFIKLFQLYGGIRFTHEEMAKVADRLKLKKELRCHGFQWYLDRVYKSMVVPTDRGRVM